MTSFVASDDLDNDDLDAVETDEVEETEDKADEEQDDANGSEEKEPNLDDLPKPVQDLVRKKVKEVRELRRQVKRLSEKPSEDAASVEEVETKWKSRFVTVAATAALTAAGGKNPAKLLRLLDTSDLEVDDDGDVDGLEDQIDELKGEFPELFGQVVKAEKKTSSRRPDVSNKTATTKKLSASEIQAAALQGR